MKRFHATTGAPSYGIRSAAFFRGFFVGVHLLLRGTFSRTADATADP